MTRTNTSAAGTPVLLALAGLVGGAARVALLGAAVPPAVANGYLAVLTVASRTGRRRTAGGVASAAGHRIAVLVPADDEEPIIGSTVASIVGQDYPAALRTVHVVADNCTDLTAEVAGRHGAQVHVRDEPLAPGKGPALGWLVQRVLAEGPRPDAFVVIDADTTMHPSFLRQVDAALDGPHSAWQGYYTVRDPELSPSTAFRHAALILRHYVRPLGRTALGGSTGLFGNGMVFRTDLLARRGFSAHLTEDLELQLELLLDGELVGFLPEAVVEAEMPTTLAGAASQNERWEAGRLQLARRFVPELARRALRPGTAHRAAHVDAALDQLVPPLSVLGAVTAAAAAAACLPRMGGSRTGRIGRRLAWASAAALGFHVLAGLRWAEAPRATYRALLRAPQMAWWKLRLWLRVLARPRRGALDEDAAQPAVAPRDPANDRRRASGGAGPDRADDALSVVHPTPTGGAATPIASADQKWAASTPLRPAGIATVPGRLRDGKDAIPTTRRHMVHRATTHPSDRDG